MDMNKRWPNLKFQIMKHEHDMWKIRFQQDFIIRTRKNKKGCDKIMYPKLILNRLKVIRNSTPIYTQEISNLHMAHVHLCVPMNTHVSPRCTHVSFMCEL
jgi:hypothetical protein